ncbi:helix-turn-helix domain-containing protein [Paraburkholderia rhynchosiae]|nr:helix-turn-helix transcriptional regulator [Paraburkholderia rhynchosiae]CAB3730627.1 hypothetical protein LMG27174_05763 [Paraburkholderia rhynchosiae]
MKEDVGDRLNELMQAHPLYRGRGGQSALGKKTGVPQPTINRILGKKSLPELGTLSKLAIEFGVTTDWLMTGRPPKFIADIVLTDSAGNVTLVEAKQHRQDRRAVEKMAAEQALPEYVSEAIAAIHKAYADNVPREAFDAVRVLFSQLKPSVGGTITPPNKDEAVKSSTAMQSIRETAERAQKDAESHLATRTEDQRAARRIGEKRSKNIRH